MLEDTTPAPAEFPSYNDILTDLETEAASPASEAVPEVPDTPQEVVPETPVVEDTPATPVEEATPEPEAILYEFKADGQTRKVSLDELTRLASAGSNYTRDKMALAERERQIQATIQQKEAEFAARQAQIEQNWRDENALALQYQRLQEAKQQAQNPQQQPQQQQIPVEQIIAYATQQARQEAQAALYEEKLNTWKATTESDINRHAQDLIGKNPLLKEIEDVDVLIRRSAGKLVERDRLAGVTTTVEQVKTYMADAAKKYVAPLEKRIKDSEQAAIMRHAKAQKPAIEPKGGNIPAVQSPVKTKWGSGDMAKQIEQELLAELRSR